VPGRPCSYARPQDCYDRLAGGLVRANVVPKEIREGADPLWVANKALPCGTEIELSGPAGTITVGVWDRGPYEPGRDLDLSRAAFLAVVGSLGPGVARMRYRVATAAP
jgi:expansin (peptidoglycan-binding protein)